EEKVLLGLRTVEGVPLAELTALGRDQSSEPLVGLIGDGFLAVHAGRLRATAQGRPVLDGVLRALLA
ncbi:MAG: coproporphyrinogen III oxidase, partial [Candidatus Omnitrophota bacterium]|nr:coproporphyrinogen III oxidase [Candidatus Omnitrophota bacterium]